MLSELSIMGENNISFLDKYRLRDKYNRKIYNYNTILNFFIVFAMISSFFILFFGFIAIFYSSSLNDEMTQFEKNKSIQIIYFTVAFSIFSFSGLAFNSNKLKKYESKYEKINKSIQSTVIEKIHKDLKNKYKAQFLDEDAPYSAYFFEENKTYRLKLKNKKIVDTEIFYDKKGEIHVNILSNVTPLSSDKWQLNSFKNNNYNSILLIYCYFYDRMIIC